MAFFARNQLKNSQKNLPQNSERDFRTILGVFKNEALKDLSLDTVSRCFHHQQLLEPSEDWDVESGSCEVLYISNLVSVGFG